MSRLEKLFVKYEMEMFRIELTSHDGPDRHSNKIWGAIVKECGGDLDKAGKEYWSWIASVQAEEI